MQINGNSGLNENLYLNNNQTLNRISTGIELNKSSDNSSSLAIANDLLSQSNGYSQAIENTNSAIALTQTADKAISEQSKILDNVREKVLQASTDTTSKDGRKAILQDIQKQLEQFDSIANSTNYNGQTLLQNSKDDSSQSSSFQFQSGLKGEDIIEKGSVQANTIGLGLNSLAIQDINNFSSSDARSYLEKLDNALSQLNDIRGEFASVQNQLQSSNTNLLSQETGTLQARSEFDTNYAQESSNFSKQNILAQIGAFGQSQAININQQTVSRLLE